MGKWVQWLYIYNPLQARCWEKDADIRNEGRKQDEGKQVTISPQEKSMWIATLNAGGVIDQIENKFLDS